MHYNTIRIETPRLVLRPFVISDTDNWFAMMRDPQVMRYWSHPAWQERRQASESITDSIAALETQEYLQLAIARKSDDSCIGMCILFHHHQASQRGEIGYCLASEAQGQGYMVEALNHFVPFLRDSLALRRLEADIHPQNQGSARVLQSMGFEQEGLLKERWCVGGEISDSALFGLLLNK